jgi:hypothetical protein
MVTGPKIATTQNLVKNPGRFAVDGNVSVTGHGSRVLSLTIMIEGPGSRYDIRWPRIDQHYLGQSALDSRVLRACVGMMTVCRVECHTHLDVSGLDLPLIVGNEHGCVDAPW